MSLEHETPEMIPDAGGALPEDMSLKEKERLTAVAKSMTEALLEATDLLGGIPWCLVHEKHGVSLFRADVANDVPCNVHAVCKFNSDIEDVAESMITHTTEAYKRMMGMLSSDFLDGAVIQTIVEPTELNPHRYVALKWAAFKSSSRFGKDRDFIILEYVDMIEDDQGQKIAFRIMESVDVPNNSPFAESPKYTRDIVPLMGFMYHTTKKPGELRLTYTCNFDKNGDLPAWAANSAIQSHVEKCINGILKYIENFRATKEEIVLPHQVIPMSEQDHCRICEKNFCVLRRKYNCLKCGEVICSNCSSLRNAIVPEVGERQLRVCTACVLAARRSSKTPAPPDGLLSTASAGGNGNGNSNSNGNGNGNHGSSSASVRSPSTATVDSDVSSVRSGATGSIKGGGAGTPTMTRTQSFCHVKRRSLDDVLDPVRSRLIEYKLFSDSAESITIPKANFPGRSFSDGLIMRKNTLFGAKRRGSPADLAISLEAFRQHQIRMGNGDPQPDDPGEQSDEETMRQFQSMATTPSASSTTSSSSVGSPPSQVTVEEVFAPLTESALAAHEPRAARSRGSRGGHHRRSAKPARDQSPESNQSAHAPSLIRPETRARFNEAMDKVQGIIDAAEQANSLAQHARKLSHHRILALQREHQVMQGICGSDNNDPGDGGGYDGPEDDGSGLASTSAPSTRVRRVVCQTRHGPMLYGRDPTLDSPHHQQQQQQHHHQPQYHPHHPGAELETITRSMAELHHSNQYVDPNYRRHASAQGVAYDPVRGVHSGRDHGRYH